MSGFYRNTALPLEVPHKPAEDGTCYTPDSPNGITDRLIGTNRFKEVYLWTHKNKFAVRTHKHGPIFKNPRRF